MRRGDIIELDIVEFAFGGKGIAKVPSEDGDYIVFVANAFPGQKVSAKIEKKRNDSPKPNCWTSLKEVLLRWSLIFKK